MAMTQIETLQSEFRRLFERPAAAAARAPGRVNLIGEHIDYLGGTVLPIAIDRGVAALAAFNHSDVCRVASLQYEDDGAVASPIAQLHPHPERPWANYLIGVVRQFRRAKIPIQGLDLLVDGDVPPGSGLSSSAAVEVAAATALNVLFGAGMTPEELTELAWRAEREFVGVPCGFMDQAASALCEADHALMLDCSAGMDLLFRQARLPSLAGFIVAHCGVPRRLAGSEYETRQKECAEAFAAIQSFHGKTYRNLCRVPVGEFEAYAASRPRDFPPALRARYAIEEHLRVFDFCRAVEDGDLVRAGRRMNQSHQGLRDLFSVSTPELDDLVESARGLQGVFGARLTGAGFGGCAILLTLRNRNPLIIEELTAVHYEPRGIAPILFETRAAGGAAEVPLRG